MLAICFKICQSSKSRQRDCVIAFLAFWREYGSKLTTTRPVRGVSFLVAAIVTGDAEIIVVVTLSGKEKREN